MRQIVKTVCTVVVDFAFPTSFGFAEITGRELFFLELIFVTKSLYSL
jgi:hypothetical protein